MNTYLDFKKVSLYITYIKNIKWFFNFFKERITATTDIDYVIYDSKTINKDVSNYNTYKECFEELVKEIKDLDLCKKCHRLDKDFCKKCELGNIIDNVTQVNNTDSTNNDSNSSENNECPICYKKLTLRYICICDDLRHKVCPDCYSNLEYNTSILCPICRQNSDDF